ncbi:hypothetical protein LCGC14_1109300 [marine sediment metagenome]|uniref:Uncharacterized protein n=1 Tax=marine sediment metagenome TaxID=412755 RepID=A0A0F9MC32_9ZZZZ
MSTRDELLAAFDAGVQAMKASVGGDFPYEVSGFDRDEFIATLPPEPENTVHVRIPVAVRPDGEWFSADAGARELVDASPDDAAEWLRGLDWTTKHAAHVVMVEADVPLPSVVTVVGTVTE